MMSPKLRLILLALAATQMVVAYASALDTAMGGSLGIPPGH